MNNKVFYLCPQVEGQQHFVCWGFDKNCSQNTVKQLVLAGLADVSVLDNQWIVNRSFSVLMGEDKQLFLVAIPRQISVKIMAILNEKFKQAGLQAKHLITSYHNSLSLDFPFYPVISYDRGFIYDATVLNECQGGQALFQGNRLRNNNPRISYSL